MKTYILGRHEAAAATAEEAVETNPAGALEWQARAVSLAHLSRVEEALIAIQRADILWPGNPAYLWMQAVTLRRLDRPEEALTTLDRADSR